MEKYTSLEHIIRNIRTITEENLSEGGAGFGGHRGDKPKGTPAPFLKKVTITPPGDPKHNGNRGAQSNAGARVSTKGANAEPIKMEEKESIVPNEGDAPTVADLGARGAPTEGGGKKKKIKEEADVGAKERRKIENVGRPDTAKTPFSVKSKIAKQGEIRAKIIDENAERIHTIKKILAKEPEDKKKTEIDFNPKIKKPEAGEVAESMLGTAGGFIGKKVLPGAGLAFGAADAYNRYNKGDYLGAGMAGLSGLTSLVPGVGTAVSAGLDAANLYRDYKHGEFDHVLDDDEKKPEPTSATPAPSPVASTTPPPQPTSSLQAVSPTTQATKLPTGLKGINDRPKTESKEESGGKRKIKESALVNAFLEFHRNTNK